MNDNLDSNSNSNSNSNKTNQTTKQECAVCCDIVDGSKTVECLGCNYISCITCQKRYLLESNVEAHCMNCRAKFSLKYLYSKFHKTWIDKTYRDHCKEFALNREKSKIPESIIQLPRIRASRERYKLMRDLEFRRKTLKQELREINQQLRELALNRYNDNNNDNNVSEEKPVEKINFLCPCPIETCKGLIESRTFACGVCDKKICKSCRMKLENGVAHECKQDDIDTVKLLRTDTKPCPKCAVPIHRYEGCPQMWCTQCHVAFDWRTGKIELGTVHNPHALEWQRRNGERIRDINAVPCGGLVNFRDLVGNPASTLLGFRSPKYIQLERMYQRTAELNYIIEEHCQPLSFDDLRASYLLNEFDEKAWRQKIFARERTNARRSAMMDATVTLRTLFTERFRVLAEAFLSTKNTKKHRIAYEKFIDDMNRIRDFFNEITLAEMKPLGNKDPVQITNDWRFSNAYRGT